MKWEGGDSLWQEIQKSAGLTQSGEACRPFLIRGLALLLFLAAAVTAAIATTVATAIAATVVAVVAATVVAVGVATTVVAVVANAVVAVGVFVAGAVTIWVTIWGLFAIVLQNHLFGECWVNIR